MRMVKYSVGHCLLLLLFRWAGVSSECGVVNRRQFGEVERCGQSLLSSRAAVGPVDLYLRTKLHC